VITHFNTYLPIVPEAGIYNGVLNSNLYYSVAYTTWGPWSAATQFYTGLPV